MGGDPNERGWRYELERGWIHELGGWVLAASLVVLAFVLVIAWFAWRSLSVT